MTDPFDNPAMRAMRALQERDEEMRRLAEGPAFRAARELQASPAMQAIRQLQERERAMGRLTEGSAFKTALELADSPAMQAVRRLHERDEEMRRLVDLPTLKAVREQSASVSENNASNEQKDLIGEMPPLDGPALPPESRGGLKRSDELQRIAGEAARAKAALGRQIEQIDPAEGGSEIEELEILRRATSVQERESRYAARIERRRERKAEADYWFRQWMNSLAIGNGAGFLAVTSGLLQATRLELALTLVFQPLTCFGLGVLSAGLLRLLVWAGHASPSGSRWQRLSQGAAVVATVASALLFTFGLATAVVGIAQFNSKAAAIATRTAAIEGQELRVRELEAAEKIAAHQLKALTKPQPAVVAAPASSPLQSSK